MPVEVLPEITIVWPEEWKQSTKRVLLDLDGVVVSYDFASLVWDKFHVRIDPTRIFAYNLADVLGVSSKEINDMFHTQLWGNPQFNDDALEVLSDWNSKGYEIVIYSNRVKYMGEFGLAKWLIENKIPYSRINGGEGNYDFHIDDRPEKLCDTDSKVKLLYSQPWNLLCLNIKRKLTRINSWQEIKEVVG